MSKPDLVDRVPKELFVNGAWRPSSSGKTFEVEDPSTGRRLATVADGTVADGQAALTAAATAQPEWQRTAPRERGEILRRAFDRLMASIDDFALLVSLEMGKPLAEARSEVVYGAEFLRWFSEEAVRVSGRYSTAPEGRARLLVTKRAVGPCLLVTPWNFPLAMVTRKVGPAVAAGCTMVLKPSELTPLTAALFASVMHEAGLPPGVLNVVQTTGADRVTRPLLADERLRKVSFTGSTAVGRRILASAAERVLRCSMELGGNAPFLVFADADLEAAVDGAMVAKMRNMGQACTAANRFLVQAPIEGEFAARLSARMKGLTLGRGTDPGTTVGPMIDDKARRKIHALVDDAIANGARALTGGVVPTGAGYFYPPTVLVDVPRRAKILREEIFGPVAAIVAFHDEDEAVSLANDTEYGLAAYVFTRDLNRGIRLGECLESGMLGLNVGAISNAAAPFGGVKQSGLGREGGFEGIEEYLSTQYIGIADPYADLRGREPCSSGGFSRRHSSRWVLNARGGKMSTDTTVATIERLEDERYAAMLGKDGAALERLLHAELIYMHSSGVSDTKASYMTGLADGVWDYRRIERTNQTIKVHGGLALVFNRLSISIVIRGVPKELDNRALAVWVADKAGWRLIALQSGAIPQPSV